MPHQFPLDNGSAKAIYSALTRTQWERWRIKDDLAHAVIAGDRLSIARCQKVLRSAEDLEAEFKDRLMDALKREHNVR